MQQYLYIEPGAHQLIKNWFAVVVALGLLCMGYLIPGTHTVFLIAATVTVLLLLALAVIGPELATWLVVFALYINLGGIATQLYNVPLILAGSFSLLLAVPLANYLLVQRQAIIVDPIFKLMLAFLAAVLISSLTAKDELIALMWIAEFVLEGLVLYFLITNVVRSLDVLKRVLWVLMLVGVVLSSLTLYQEITLDYANNFGGLAQRTVEDWTGKDQHLVQDSFIRTRTHVGGTNRSRGPIDDPNRYAQNLLMLVPLGLFLLWRARGVWKLTAALATLLIFSGVLLTYSRGAFVAVLLIFGVLTVMGYVSLRRGASVLGAFLALSLLVAPGYFVRLQSILGVQGLVSESASVQPDQVTRGRLTEMAAAFNVFRDHPLIGVGPGQYLRFYSREYMSDPDIALRKLHKDRRAHTLYFELAAETGIIGLSLFITIVVVAMRRLLRVRRRWLTERPELAQLAMAFFVAILAYLGTAVFLHFSFQRYFWLMLALSSAAYRLLITEDPHNKGVI